MSAIYDHGGILAIMAAKRTELATPSFLSIKHTGFLLRLFGRWFKSSVLTLKRRPPSLQFSAENPYDMLYETYWGIVFQD